MSEKPRTNTKIKSFSVGKLRDILLLSAVALLLIFAIWKIFYASEGTESTSAALVSDNEQRLSELLQEMEGVGSVNVMICETEDGVQSVVVVCDGANDLKVIMNIREAVAAALGTDERSVKIYQMKE